MKIFVGTVWINSNNPHLLPRLFGHLKLFIEFKCPSSNTYDLIQKTRNGQEICSSFLAEVFTFVRNYEHFQWHFGFIEKDFIFDPS